MIELLKRQNNRLILSLVIFLLIGFTAYQTKFFASKSDNISVTNSKKNVAKSSFDSQSSSLDNKKYIYPIYNYLHNKYGMSATAIAGILGNWIQESGIDPIAVQGDWEYRSLENSKKNTNSQRDIGFAQWSSERREKLIEYATQHYSGEWWQAQCQLEFMTQYDGSFVEVLKNYAINDDGNVVKNAVEFNNKWEVSPDDEKTVEKGRGHNAVIVYQYMQKNNMNGKTDINKLDTLKYIGTNLSY